MINAIEIGNNFVVYAESGDHRLGRWITEKRHNFLKIARFK